jgi:PRC-barrel domain
VRRIGEAASDEVSGLLREHRDELDALADRLIERETLDEADAYAAAGIDHPDGESALALSRGKEWTVKLELGSPVRCTDGPFGELADVVIDPIARRVTHLVVAPQHRHGLARLVPIDLAAAADNGHAAVLLRCTLEHARQLPSVQEFAYLRLGEFPAKDPDWDVGIENVLALPYYDYAGFGEQAIDYDSPVSMTYDRVPKGEVEIRRASDVVSADGHRLGHVDGFLVAGDDQITHVVLERGHLWGRRDVTIPIGAVTRVTTDSVTVRLTKDEVAALPAIPVHRWAD